MILKAAYKIFKGGLDDIGIMQFWLQHSLLVIVVTLLSLHSTLCMIVEHNHSDDRRPSGYDYIKNIKAAIEFDLRDKRVVKCYQCVYSPPRYETKMVARRRRDGHTDLVNVTKEIQGGWAPCKGPFSIREARQHGIDAGHCLSNCYTRLDHLGNMLRGCYRGEYGVNPNKTGCHQQAGHIYCFCEGDRCNNHLPSSLPETTQKPQEVRRVQKVYDEPYERGRSYHRSQYSQPDRQNVYSLRYRDRPAGGREGREYSEVSKKNNNQDSKQNNNQDRYQPTKPKTREYRDKNSYMLINSAYEKEVKEDEKPATRYRSVAEFGREAPSREKKEKYDNYKDEEQDRHSKKSMKSSPHNKVTHANELTNERDGNEIERADSPSSRRSLKSPARPQSASSADWNRYRPVYHSYTSDLADKYRKGEGTKRKEAINQGVFSSTDDRSSRKKSETEKPSSHPSDSWSDRGREQKVQPTTQDPLTSRKVSSNTDVGSWDFADEFMTQPEEDEVEGQGTKWPTYQKSAADDKKDGDKVKADNSQSWYIKDSDNPSREIVSSSQAEKRREKQGLYDYRWYF